MFRLKVEDRIIGDAVFGSADELIPILKERNNDGQDAGDGARFCIVESYDDMGCSSTHLTTILKCLETRFHAGGLNFQDGKNIIEAAQFVEERIAVHRTLRVSSVCRIKAADDGLSHSIYDTNAAVR